MRTDSRLCGQAKRASALRWIASSTHGLRHLPTGGVENFRSVGCKDRSSTIRLIHPEGSTAASISPANSVGQLNIGQCPESRSRSETRFAWRARARRRRPPSSSPARCRTPGRSSRPECRSAVRRRLPADTAARDAGLEELLHGPHLARPSTIHPDETPHTMPIWYEWRDRQIHVSAQAQQVKAVLSSEEDRHAGDGHDRPDPASPSDRL